MLAIEALDVARVASAAPRDLSNFGLDQATAVMLTTAGGESAAFRFGHSTGRNDEIYVQRADSPAVLEVRFQSAPFVKGARETLRDRHLVACAAREIVRIDARRDGVDLPPAARTPDGDWSSPPGTTVDAVALEALATALSGLTAAHVLVTPSPGELAPTGLERPWLVLRARRVLPGARPHTESIDLALGLKIDDGERWARCTLKDDASGVTDAYTIGIAEETVTTLDRSTARKPAPSPTGGEAPPASAGHDAPSPATGGAR